MTVPLGIGRAGGADDRFFDDVDRAYVVDQLEGRLHEPVTLRVLRSRSSPLVLPGQPVPASDSAEQGRAERLAREIAALVPTVSVAVEEVPGRTDPPAIVVGGPASGRVRFIGVPRVNLFRALLEAVRRASTRDWDLDCDLVRTLGGLAAPVGLRTFATPTCPACPPVVSLTIRLALAGERVAVDVIDGTAFVDAVTEWGVGGVPTVVLNDAIRVEGPVPEQTLVEFALHAADPRHPAPMISSVPFLSCGRLDGPLAASGPGRARPRR